ncbi:MAG: S9 family peptidase [Chiayiivirga sp.]|jgi:dipeptidyl aminopeptidase/acylaminoacyl peptidase|uniref:alpha/beta hydrolase family protein n=1 Tax=Chiayiivirga sp. TaxID=2041042 RepID=UPI0025C4866F|nr:S9 family peptidase [Chiayiivirga sp.]MCI1729181.1 S9 family peptidase [Chiayiivirga sp.]
MNRIRAVSLLALLPLTSVLAAPPPVRDFVKHPSYSAVRISPTGEYLAMTVDRGEQDVLVVLKTDDLSVVKLNKLPDEKSVGTFAWTSPERLIFNSVKKFGSYAVPFGTGEWYAVNADGSQPRPLVFHGTRDATQRGKTVSWSEQFNLIDTLRDDDENVLMVVSYPRSKDGAGTELVQLDTLSGRRKSLGRAPRENCGIALDAKKQMRFAICYDSEGEDGSYDSWTELYRRDDSGSWSLLNRAQDSGQDVSIAGTAADGRIYATRSDRKGTTEFGLLNSDSGAFERLFHDPVSDPAGYVHAADGDTVIGVVTMAGVPQVTLVDEAHPDSAIYQGLAQAFPNQFVDFFGATDDGNQIVVGVYSDRNPGELYLYDRKSGQARFLMQQRQWVDPKTSASVEPFSFTSRDGLTIHGYLTLPAGSDGKNLPLILNPHGGPMGPRDAWGYSWETQLLASRGYAVMQVNYRGSGGFGKAFQDRAYGQWAEGIMNDLIDAVQWGVAQGKVDKNRVCIYGGSFGGYAALMAPARAPDLFKCAFGYVGLYDAQIQMKLSDTSKREDGMRYLKRAFGATRKEQDAMSPITHAGQIKLPVYLAAGARDARCPPEHTEAMAKALQEQGNKPEGMIIQSGEMHGFYGEDAREHLYTEMLAFFGRHIGAAGGAEAAAD